MRTDPAQSQVPPTVRDALNQGVGGWPGADGTKRVKHRRSYVGIALAIAVKSS